jgi:hypothetical protein
MPPFSLRQVLFATTICTAACLQGCSMGDIALSGPAPVAAAHISGSVHGGQQPITNATIGLYAVGTAGYGSAAASLLTAGVTSGAGGSFSVTGDYTCPSS